jgi:hypothetical protein
MKLAILLPGVVPDMRWIQAYARADRVILDDHTPWSRKSRVHRYQIRTPQGTQWLNVPVVKSDGKGLRETRMDGSQRWAKDHMRTLAMNYRNSLFFDFLEAEIEDALLQAEAQTNVVDASMMSLQLILKLLGLPKKWTWASEQDGWTSDPDALAVRLGADVVLLEHNSRHYQRQPITTPIVEMPHPEYRQHFGGFYPECGILDYLFAKGPGFSIDQQ